MCDSRDFVYPAKSLAMFFDPVASHLFCEFQHEVVAVVVVKRGVQIDDIRVDQFGVGSDLALDLTALDLVQTGLDVQLHRNRQARLKAPSCYNHRVLPLQWRCPDQTFGTHTHMPGG